MAKFYAYAVGLFILVALTGCGPAHIKMKVPDYSIGPVSSEAFPDLVQSAIPQNKGEIRIFGKANWLGFVESPGYFHAVSPYFSGVVALTDTDIFLLLYKDDEQRYEILLQMPYTGIRFDPIHGRAGGPLCLYIEESGFSFGEKSYTSYGRTYLEFTRPTGIRSDPEKNKLAHLLFEEKVARHIVEQPPITSFDDQY